ncbi:MAG: hypothetical protein ISR90_02870 [Candidatus Marinimicrobia bacterium]|nr:hypothetical protein [Candidatus Neomarinimicrobiota bacterium]MBL7022982.1 hypothetical protein [Candidatus Neomarinimicrobiota bacterium]MBL7109532.1 hypothetical protein [Candidatus Neomarinimicrobiota bacterium]
MFSNSIIECFNIFKQTISCLNKLYYPLTILFSVPEFHWTSSPGVDVSEIKLENIGVKVQMPTGSFSDEELMSMFSPETINKWKLEVL